MAGMAISGAVRSIMGAGSQTADAISQGQGSDAGAQAGGAPSGASRALSVALDVAGKVWNLPNTIIGLGVGAVTLAADIVQSTILTAFTGRNHFQNIGISFGNNAIQIRTGLDLPGQTDGGLTLGNTIIYNNSSPNQNITSPYTGLTVNLGRHERAHTYQGQKLGPLYLPAMIKNGVASPNNKYERQADYQSIVR